ncbi:hypothetical protein GC197_13330 [bacterium]|nr:hypothetical protein [bacterium]
MSMFSLAWVIVGYCVANLFLKMRWNLVGGVFLLVFGAVIPTGLAWTAYYQSQFYEQFPGALLLSSTGVLEYSFELLWTFSLSGYFLGTLVGTVIGLWPKKTSEGNYQRNAHNLNVWKLAISGPTALLVAWSLFLLADMRAQQRVKTIRDRHLAILQAQDEVAPRLMNDAARKHDALLLALMQDASPDWVLARNRSLPELSKSDQRFQIVARPAHRWRTDQLSDVELLKIFDSGFSGTDQVKKFVRRHDSLFQKLRQSVLQDKQECHPWDIAVARYAAIHGLVELLEGKQSSALADLKLLRLMETQSLQNQNDDAMQFLEIEQFRFLLFQAYLGNVSPVPDEVYEEMLTDVGDIGPSLRRTLKRNLHQEIVNTIDEALNERNQEHPQFKGWFCSAAQLILYQEHLPASAQRIEEAVNATFLQDFDPYTQNPWVAFPLLMKDQEAWLARGVYPYFLYQATYSWYDHHLSRDLVETIREVERNREKNGRYWTQAEFQKWMASSNWKPPVFFDYISLHETNSGPAVGAVVFRNDHKVLHDHFGLYLGPAIIPIVEATSPSLQIRDEPPTRKWELNPVPGKPFSFLIPSVTAGQRKLPVKQASKEERFPPTQ